MIDNHPLVSVIIPCYNHGKYLRDAIESVLQQTYPNLEIIVVDDGSTDNSANVALSVGCPVRVISKENSGVSASRNRGVLECSGSFVSFLDADDVMHPTCIETRVGPMLTDPRVGISAGRFRITDEQLIPFPDEVQYQFRYSAVDRFTSFRICIPSPGIVFRREVFSECGLFDPFLRGCEDWDMQIRACQKFACVFVDSFGTDYRQVPGSASRNTFRMFDDGVRMLKKNLFQFGTSWTYRRHAFVGLFLHTSGAVFSYLRRERSGLDRFQAFLRLFILRPLTLVFFVFLVCRFFWNQLLRRSLRANSSN